MADKSYAAYKVYKAEQEAKCKGCKKAKICGKYIDTYNDWRRG